MRSRNGILRNHRPVLELLEDREVPAVLVPVGPGTFEITDTTSVPNHTWASPDTGTNTVPQNNTLRGTFATTVGFTGADLAAVRVPGGAAYTFGIFWLEADAFANDTVDSVAATYSV